MRYRGYEARVVYDAEAMVLFGEVEGLRDVVTFEATSVEQLATAFRESVEDYLVLCAGRGKAPDKPYAGKILLRVDPRLHRELAFAAARAHESLNTFVAGILSEWLDAGVLPHIGMTLAEIKDDVTGS